MATENNQALTVITDEAKQILEVIKQGKPHTLRDFNEVIKTKDFSILSTGLIYKTDWYGRLKVKVYYDAYNQLETNGKIDYETLFKFYGLKVKHYEIDSFTRRIKCDELEPHLLGSINAAINDYFKDTRETYIKFKFESGACLNITLGANKELQAWQLETAIQNGKVANIAYFIKE